MSPIWLRVPRQVKGVSLHHHTTFSYQDGFGTPEEHAQRSADLGMEAQAVTEHGNVSSAVKHEQACNKVGIKPIFGVEAYVGPANMRKTGNTRKWHMTILAMDETGYRNLNRLVSRSWETGFYQWPTMHESDLFELNEGLIFTSGCSDSKLNCDLLGGKGRERGSEKRARRTLDRYLEAFGDRFYLETQQFPELERTGHINRWYEQESKRLGIPLLATADVHYPHARDSKMQTILHTAGRGGVSVAVTEASWEYSIKLTHPKSDAFWLKRLRGTGLSRGAALHALDSTAEVAGRCNVVIPKATNLKFPLPPDTTLKEFVWDLLRKGWRYRAKSNRRLIAERRKYMERVHYEMSAIEEKGFLDYFAMLAEATIWCKENGIAVGPARGSAAASLVCYLLRITEIDPLPFPSMLFERFIDFNRTDLPDIDLDFDDEKRHLLSLIHI